MIVVADTSPFIDERKAITITRTHQTPSERGNRKGISPTTIKVQYPTMKDRIGSVVELLVLVFTAIYLFWGWADYSAHGNPIGFFLVFNSLIFALLATLTTTATYRIAPKSPWRAITSAFAVAIALGDLACIGSDLRRFQILGGPGKEMQALLMNLHIPPAAQGQWLQDTELLIRREFFSTGLIALLLLAYISRLASEYGRERIGKVG